MSLRLPFTAAALAVAASLLQPHPAAAQTAPPPAGGPGNAPPAGEVLTLPEALNRAFTTNPALAAARREIDATGGALQQARLRPNPELGVAQEDLRRGRQTTTLALTQPLEMGGKRAARTALAERVQDQARVGVEQVRADLRAAVLEGYYEALVARERLRLARESLAVAASSADATGKRVQAGKVSPVEETRARVAQAGAQAELAQAEGAFRSARQRLAALWGDTQPGFADMAGRLDLPAATPDDAWVSQRMADAPALRRARLEVERWRAAAELERARAVPDIAISLGAKRLQAEGVTQAVVGLSIPLPVFNRNQGGIAEALAREDKARDELAVSEIQLASSVAQAREQLGAARAEALTLQRDAVPGARSAFQAASQGFQLGKFSFLETLDAQRTLVATQAQYLRALSDTWRAAAELERLLAVADDGGSLLYAPASSALPSSPPSPSSR